jgi:hypothetical protein
LLCCSNQNQVTGYSGRPGNDIIGLDIPCQGKTFCQVSQTHTKMFLATWAQVL